MAFIWRSVEHFGQLNILVNNAIKAGDNTIQYDTTKTAVTGTCLFADGGETAM